MSYEEFIRRITRYLEHYKIGEKDIKVRNDRDYGRYIAKALGHKIIMPASAKDGHCTITKGYHTFRAIICANGKIKPVES